MAFIFVNEIVYFLVHHHLVIIGLLLLNLKSFWRIHCTIRLHDIGIGSPLGNCFVLAGEELIIEGAGHLLVVR